ncbi:class I SAM-dependent methyltransferase [Streptomyces sp. NPDC002004]
MPQTPVVSRSPVAPPPPSWSAGPYAAALRAGRGPLYLRRTDGWLLPLDVERWCACADAADLSALVRCEGAVLDIGCGPGRLVDALAERGHRVLGIDVSEAAVAHTVRRLGSPPAGPAAGAGQGQALCRSVFEPLPDEGRWDTALLIDGNIGIGGDPRTLLVRVAELVAPGGLLIAEAAPAEVDERVHVGVVADGHPERTGELFPWARLGVGALVRHARRAGWRRAGQWTAGGRPFVALRRRTDDAVRRHARGAVRTASHSADRPNSTAVTVSQRGRNTSAGSRVADV